WKIFQMLATYTSIFTILLICDYYLDGAQESYPIDDKNIILDPFSDIVSIEGENYVVNNYDFWKSRGSMPIRVNHSYLFDDKKSISILVSPLPAYDPNSHSQQRMRNYINFEGKELYTAMSYSSVYGVFPVLH